MSWACFFAIHDIGWARLTFVVVSPVPAAWATMPGFYVSRGRMGIVRTSRISYSPERIGVSYGDD
jgi:hypothetical protein